jgi:hypothetical protein
MHPATRFLLMALTPVAFAACQKKPAQPQDQNIAVDQPMTNETMANAEIETLPSDESSGTPSDQLANGSDNPDVNDVNTTNNSY